MKPVRVEEAGAFPRGLSRLRLAVLNPERKAFLRGLSHHRLVVLNLEKKAFLRGLRHHKTETGLAAALAEVLFAVAT